MNAEQAKLLEEWYEALEAANEVKPILEKELELRKRVFAELFTAPTEGVNKIQLDSEYTLKGTYKLDRKVDETLLKTVAMELEENGYKGELPVDWKPSLATALYRRLTEDEARIFDKALIVKPSTPTLELVTNKKKGA